MIPEGKVVVSESGIFTRNDLDLLARANVNAVLVGEALVTAPDIGERYANSPGLRERVRPLPRAEGIEAL